MVKRVTGGGRLGLIGVLGGGVISVLLWGGVGWWDGGVFGDTAVCCAGLKLILGFDGGEGVGTRERLMVTGGDPLRR